MRVSAFLVALLLVPLTLLPTGGAAPQELQTGYLPRTLLGIWCSADEHPIVPQDDASDYDKPIPWALSGEPECAFANAMNSKREAEGRERIPWGLGTAAHWTTDADAATLATAWATDDVFGEDAGYVTVTAEGESGQVTSAGCGLQAIVLPEPVDHWLPPEQGMGVWWANIDAIGIDDELDLCFATTGIMHATWGA